MIRFPACWESGRISNVVYKRSWRELFLRESRFWTKKEKEPKRKKLRKGTLVETAAAEEIK
jgi:hypothetical protein